MKILDLFCCSGGASRGYAQAGFEVMGVDTSTANLKNYPFSSTCADALEFVSDSTFIANNFDAIHASPPCQRFTHGNAGSKAANKWPDLITPLRPLLKATGLPWVIENSPRAPLFNPTIICGCMFNLTATDADGTLLHLQRKRAFETSFALVAPKPCNHSYQVQWAGVYGGARRDKVEARTVRKGGYVPPDKPVCLKLLGLPQDLTISWGALYEAIPPAYTKYIGSIIQKVA